MIKYFFITFILIIVKTVFELKTIGAEQLNYEQFIWVVFLCINLAAIVYYFLPMEDSPRYIERRTRKEKFKHIIDSNRDNFFLLVGSHTFFFFSVLALIGYSFESILSFYDAYPSFIIPCGDNPLLNMFNFSFAMILISATLLTYARREKKDAEIMV